MMVLPGVVALAVVAVERKLPVYSGAVMLCFGTLAMTTQGPDTEQVDREVIRATARESARIPEMRPLIVTALKDGRMTITEFRGIRQVWDDGVGRRKSAARASAADDGERELKAIIGSEGAGRR